MDGRKVRVSVVHTSASGQSITTECFINPQMPLSDVLKDMAMLLGVKTPWVNYALRFAENDELVSDQSLKRRIKDGDTLLFVSSPAHLASQLVEDLSSEDEQILKRATFSLQKFIKEEEFVDEFISRKGLQKLQDVIITGQGNTLAYALTSLHNLMEHDHGWDKFSSVFISTLVSVIVKQNLVNICRPATAIIIKLVLADKSTENSPIQCYGFDVVNAAVTSQSSFLPTLVHRLSATDYLLQLNSMQLINVLFRKATEKFRGEFVYLLDALNIRKVVVGLMQASPAEELGKQLVEFQRLLIQEGYRRKRLAVDTRNPVIFTMLEEIWEASGLKAEGDFKWRKIGFETEVPRKEMNRVGLLGLETIHNFVHANNDFVLKNLHEQLSRPPERRSPFARACIEVIEILSDFWEVSTGYTTTTSYQPLLLEFEEVNLITLTFFLRMWNEMEAQNNGDDINRVATVVRSQFRHVVGIIQPSDPNGLLIFDREMRTAPYSVVRERQLKELEIDDMLMSRIPVRNLRERLYKESYEFIKQQRIDCIVAGAWFPVIREKGRAKNLYRYYRLGPNKKFLHYADFTEMTERRPLLETLPKKVDMALVTDILTGSSAPIFYSKKNATENPALCFSLVSSVSDTASSASLADFVCSNSVQYAEWTDGFNMLLDKNIANRETAEYIRQLTEVGVKLALLDLTGEGVDIPTFAPDVPESPSVWSYHYDEEGGGLREGLGGLASLAGAMMLGLTQMKQETKSDAGDSDNDGEGEGFNFQ
ncbi:hypothetical protein HDU97_004558 [Phlyctochytrium planicorne]|nr:hypothetical protein HDU97_004558 [Phlyctochytrium planicorne]